MHDLGLYGVETCRSQRHRYQTPLNLLIYRIPFGNYGRVTDSYSISLLGPRDSLNDPFEVGLSGIGLGVVLFFVLVGQSLEGS